MAEDIIETQDESLNTAEGNGEEVLEGEVFLEEELVNEEIEEDVEQLKSKIEELRTELEIEKEKTGKYLESWQYAQADFQNYKKRIEKDRQNQQETLRVNAMRQYIEVLDDVQLALKNQPEDKKTIHWAAGIELIQRKMLTVLENEGVKMIPTDGEFDPNLHEAISSEPNEEIESGHIIGVVQEGYQIRNRVLRPARVRVAL
ncbi:MAG: nucleotide exchange factor GrpE [Anaerolineaceae bacterium]|nr:nucleotide exchange factor GrpE [Anaerolineaceae bacterium]